MREYRVNPLVNPPAQRIEYVGLRVNPNPNPNQSVLVLAETKANGDQYMWVCRHAS